MRVALVGEELAEHRREMEQKRRETEEALQRKKREDELEMLAVAGSREGFDGEDDDASDDGGDENADTNGNNSGGNTTTNSGSNAVSQIGQTPDLRRQSSTASSKGDTNSQPNKKRRKFETSLISKFLQPNFPMFESKETVHQVDDFGAANDDLDFEAAEADAATAENQVRL
jgi:hypothetical protein